MRKKINFKGGCGPSVKLDCNFWFINKEILNLLGHAHHIVGTLKSIWSWIAHLVDWVLDVWRLQSSCNYAGLSPTVCLPLSTTVNKVHHQFHWIQFSSNVSEFTSLLFSLKMLSSPSLRIFAVHHIWQHIVLLSALSCNITGDYLVKWRHSANLLGLTGQLQVGWYELHREGGVTVKGGPLAVFPLSLESLLTLVNIPEAVRSQVRRSHRLMRRLILMQSWK